MTTLRPYPAYKPSCIDWLGDFQCHWNAMKLTHADARLCGGAAARDSAGRLAAPGGMTIKRDDTQVVPYENCWLAARSIGLYATPRWGAVARDSSGRLAAPGGMTIKRDDTQVVPYEDSCWRSDGARFLWSPGGSRRNDI